MSDQVEDVNDDAQSVVEDPSASESTVDPSSPTTQEPGTEQDQPKEGAIPPHRLKEEADKRREIEAKYETERQARLALEDRLNQLESNVKENRPKTWDDLSLDQLYTAYDNFTDSGEDNKARQLDRIIRRREAQEVAQEQIGAARAEAQKSQNWAQITTSLKDYSQQIADPDFDLSDENSPIRKLFVEIYSNKKLQADPEGLIVAGEMASARLLKEKYAASNGKQKQLSQKAAKADAATALETSSRASSPPTSIDKIEQDAFNESDPTARNLKIKNYLGSLDKKRRETQAK